MSSSYIFNEKDKLEEAVDLWIADESAAIEKYGDINTWDVSAIDDFSYLFSNKRSFNSDTFNSDISNWDVSNGINFAGMFTYATSLTKILGIGMSVMEQTFQVLSEGLILLIMILETGI